MLPPRRAAQSLVSILVLAACSGPSLDPASRAPRPTRTDDAELQPAATSSAAASQVAPSGSQAQIPTDPPRLALEVVAEGLAAPIGLATGPAGWVLAQEQAGRLIAIDSATGATAVALDITDRVLDGGERGLLGVAVHPEFPVDGRVFVHYTDRDGNTVLSEFDASAADGPIVVGPATERVLLRVEQPFANHNGGQLAFGPDGYLWLGLGDGGSAGDPLGHGQDPATLLGSILRLDVDDVPDDGNDAIGYGIPPDNPFADGVDGAPEVYHWGLRNPWRFSFDRETGELFIADVGQTGFEEVNRTDGTDGGGRNFEWAVREGNHCFSDPACGAVDQGPWVEYGRDLGCSVTGGYVYRGDAIPALDGWYLFADYCSGLLLGACLCITGDESVLAPRILLQTDASVSSFGEDADGELYVADHASGTIYRVVAGD